MFRLGFRQIFKSNNKYLIEFYHCTEFSKELALRLVELFSFLLISIKCPYIPKSLVSQRENFLKVIHGFIFHI